MRAEESSGTFWAMSLIIAGTIVAIMLLFGPKAEASRESCECRELRAIRILLEHQSGLVCDERRCLPAGTPTPNGGELP